MPMPRIQVSRTVDLVVDSLRTAILSGEYPIGSRLPPERSLAEELGVNRLTLRSAISFLQSQGLVEPQHGRGVIVQDYRANGGLELMAHIQDPEQLENTFALRKVLAAQALADACEQATSRDINLLKSIAKSQEKRAQGVLDDTPFWRGDLEFMSCLVRASNNLALRLVFNSFSKIITAHHQAVDNSLRDRESACRSYFALIALIRNRDPELAHKSVLGHLSEQDEDALKEALTRR